MDAHNSLYKIRSSAELGRYLVASRDLSPGEIIVAEPPMVFGPKAMPDPEASMPCVGCYKPIFTDIGERCSRCGWPVCAGNCPGLTDPQHHATECLILSARPGCVLDNMADYYRHDALLPLRCALLQSTDSIKWKQVLDMQSHMESRTPGTEAYDEADEFIVDYLINNFISKLDTEVKTKYLLDISKELLHKICGIIDTNALEIRLTGGSELSGLYSKTSILEHSCIPNTKHGFNVAKNAFRISVKVVTPILKDQHISTMYTHALWGTQARRQHLKDTKYFSCRCRRCGDPTELETFLSAMKCMGDGNDVCDGLHLPDDPLDDETEWSCSKCKVRVGNSQVNAIIAQMGEEVENSLMVGTVPVLENVLCRLSFFLHDNHYHLYSIKHSLVQLYGRQPSYLTEDVLDRKIKMCRDLIVITTTLDPGNARLSLYNAVLHHELHSALVLKSEKATSEEVETLVKEANNAIKTALSSLCDDLEEASGKKLFSVITESERDFQKRCKQINIDL